MKAHKMTIILALLFVFGLLAIDSVRANHQAVASASPGTGADWHNKKEAV